VTLWACTTIRVLSTCMTGLSARCQRRLHVARAHQTDTDSMANRNFPDFEEDKIACFIKTLTEKRIGPTWHVLVGRYVVACAMRR
jgi:hypothetical protein